jgi:hypothetical protein
MINLVLPLKTFFPTKKRQEESVGRNGNAIIVTERAIAAVVAAKEVT